MNPAALPDQTGKVIVITGATSGIGFETAVALAGAGATVVVSSRNQAKVDDAVARVKQRSRRDDVHGLVLDLASFASIRSAAAELLAQRPRIDVLINNAGVYLSERRLTADGFEMTFGTNHLGHFLLTNLLLDRLRASAPARVVNVSSIGHRFTRQMNFDDLQSERHYTVQEAYTQSKLANVLFTKELARRLRGTDVTANCFHPGNVATGFNRNNGPLMTVAMTVIRPFSRRPKKGAETVVWLVDSTEAGGVSGAYFVDCREATPSAPAMNADAAKRLWQVSEEQTRESVPA